MSYTHTNIVLFLLACCSLGILLAACGDTDDSHSSPTAADLTTIPQRIVVAGESLMLETYIWRDFMPITPPGGRPMIAAISIKTVSASDFPAGVDADSMWVFNNGEVWATVFTDEDRPSDPHVLSKVARDGPLWEPGKSVDVVVRVKNSDGERWLLKAASQTIHRTD